MYFKKTHFKDRKKYTSHTFLKILTKNYNEVLSTVKTVGINVFPYLRLLTL
jgi:hypothetical protein